MHALLVLQRTETKTSSGKSLILVYHDFRHSYFMELRDFVSISALYMVLKEYRFPKMNGIDSAACDVKLFSLYETIMCFSYVR